MVVETQRKVAQEKEETLNAEIAQLREQNEQLAAATRSRLQENNAGQQEEIEQLKLRLEVREATIKKLEMMNGSSKMGRLRKKKKKATGGSDSDCGSSVASTTTDL
jgi:2,3-bisphosphoglycerate-independent phosphoglycerate mutase